MWTFRTDIWGQWLDANPKLAARGLGCSLKSIHQRKYTARNGTVPSGQSILDVCNALGASPVPLFEQNGTPTTGTEPATATPAAPEVSNATLGGSAGPADGPA